jgi:hypothetical protein
MCQAEQAPGSKVTLLPDMRDGAVAWNGMSRRTAPGLAAWAGAPLLACAPLGEKQGHGQARHAKSRHHAVPSA